MYRAALAIILSLAMTLAVAGCGGDGEKSSGSGGKNGTSVDEAGLKKLATDAKANARDLNKAIEFCAGDTLTDDDGVTCYSRAQVIEKAPELTELLQAESCGDHPCLELSETTDTTYTISSYSTDGSSVFRLVRSYSEADDGKVRIDKTCEGPACEASPWGDVDASQAKENAKEILNAVEVCGASIVDGTLTGGDFNCASATAIQDTDPFLSDLFEADACGKQPCVVITDTTATSYTISSYTNSGSDNVFRVARTDSEIRKTCKGPECEVDGFGQWS